MKSMFLCALTHHSETVILYKLIMLVGGFFHEVLDKISVELVD